MENYRWIKIYIKKESKWKIYKEVTQGGNQASVHTDKLIQIHKNPPL